MILYSISSVTKQTNKQTNLLECYRSGEYCDNRNRYPTPLIIIVGMIHTIVIGFSLWTMSVANNARKEIAKTPAIKQITVAPMADNRF